MRRWQGVTTMHGARGADGRSAGARSKQVADLLGVEQVAAQLGLSDYDADITLLNRLIDAAQAAFESQCHRSLDTNTQRIEYYDGGKRHVYVREAPITTVTTLQDGVQDSARTISAVDWISSDNDNGENYNVGKIELWNTESHFGGARLGVKVTYTAGWTTSTIPQEVLEAWIRCVGYWYLNRDNAGIVSMSADGQTINWQGSAIPDEVRQAWGNYSHARNR